MTLVRFGTLYQLNDGRNMSIFSIATTSGDSKVTNAQRNLAIFVGCAGWSLPKEHVEKFHSEGTHLVRYAGCFRAVEINSSFYRSHRPSTYVTWAVSVPDDFQFAVKVPKSATHECHLENVDGILDQFLGEVLQLGKKLGPLLVQLPPRLSFTPRVASKFFATLRARFDGNVVLEPRHASWFEADAENLLRTFRVARVAADPALKAQAAVPGGWSEFAYFRLHGSPRMYYSGYSAAYLETLSKTLVELARSASVWCVFDNTAEGHATANAREMLARLRKK